MSGRVYNALGWEWLNWIVFPVVGFCLFLLGLLALRRRWLKAA